MFSKSATVIIVAYVCSIRRRSRVSERGFFAATTVAVRLATSGTDISGRTVAFARFFFGLLAVPAYVAWTRPDIKVRQTGFVVARAVTNAAAVLLVFSALRYTTVTNANMLNMSYPVFVFLLAPWVNRERTQRSHYLYLVLAMTGIVLTFALMLPGFVMPAGHELLYTMLAALFSLFGQICLTAGYRSVRSGAGSVISAARIVIAAGIGIAFLDEPVTRATLAGGLCIVLALLGVGRSPGPAADEPPSE